MAKKASSAKSVVKKAPASRAVAKPIKKVLAKPRKVQAPPRQEEAEEQLKPIKLKCPLSRKELGEYRSLLIEKRRTLMGDMDGMHAEAMRDNRDQGSSDLSTMPVHMADIGTDNYEQEFTLGLLESERQSCAKSTKPSSGSSTAHTAYAWAPANRSTNPACGLCPGRSTPLNTPA